MKPESPSPRGARHNMRGETIIDGQRGRTAYTETVPAGSLLTGNSLPKRSRMPYAILLVDDEEEMREELSDALGRDGYETETATDGIVTKPFSIDELLDKISSG
jgi:PleD family two-component response regulator